MTLYYSLVSHSALTLRPDANHKQPGLRPPCGRDGRLWPSHCAYAIQLAPQDLHFPFGKPYSSQNTVWIKGIASHALDKEASY
jgi:hypothetical protein